MPSKRSSIRHKNDGKPTYSDRNVVGYGERPPNPKWPNNATVAINFVIHYEEGGGESICDDFGGGGDVYSNNNSSSEERQRNLIEESEYEYGSRVGFWRLLRLFQQKNWPITIFAVGMALERNPSVCYELKKYYNTTNHQPKQQQWEIASGGYRNNNNTQQQQQQQEQTLSDERDQLYRTIQVHRKMFGRHPAGYYHGTPSSETRKLLVEEGGFKYDSDSYGDDLPYWSIIDGKAHLVIPYTLTENDTRYFEPGGFVTGREFYEHLKETLTYMLDKTNGEGSTPRMMTIALHGRYARPAFVAALEEFCDYLEYYHKSETWICTREQIADHWIEHHGPMGRGGKILTPAEKAKIALAKGEAILRKLGGR